MRKFITFSIFAVLTCFFSTIIVAQSSSGKLAGKVTDAATGEPLIGANVILLNTNLGSAADINGEYFILNITPGTYTVSISYVGYGQQKFTDVRIVPGVTFELNAQLSMGIDLDEIVVSGKKLFEENATNTVKVVDAETINRLPVKGVENIAALQAGVVKADGSGGADGNATLNVRGGRGKEVLYIVDGVVQNDPMTGSNYSQVSNAAIDQISFQVGGYEAKFGQAQAGIINVTTKSGSVNYKLYADALTSSFTDNFGYNLYTFSLSGPIIPGNGNHTIFLSAERGWFLDANPSYIDLTFGSIGKTYDYKPNNSSGIWRFSGKTNHLLSESFNLTLGANINTRKQRLYNHYYAKNNSIHNPIRKTNVYSFSAKISNNISSSTFWNLTLGYQNNKRERGDGVYFDNLEAYGDTISNPYMVNNLGEFIQGSSSAKIVDDAGIFPDFGRVNNRYSKIDNQSFSGNFEFTSQLGDHLLEAGFGASYSLMRYYSIRPVELAKNNRPYYENGILVEAKSVKERYERAQPYRYGYDVMGNKLSKGDDLGPNTPLLIHGYIQDRYELDDLVLNVGLRLDYFDSQAKILKNPELPFAGGSNSKAFDDGDFITKKSEFHVSPRIGIGYPVTESTVFHAQYGKFIQEPRLFDMYPLARRLQDLIQTADFSLATGNIESEETTQYEVGFRQILGDDIASLNITAFYKNIKGLTNLQTQLYFRQKGGETLEYYTYTNSDFGTVKGLAFSLSIPRISYFSLSFDYTYSISEGTGSSSSSSFTAAFRNTNGEVPKVIAPLDFDQRHTGTLLLDFYIPKGKLGFMEMFDVNFLVSFASGRPYTPLETQDLNQGSTLWGSTSGYVNSTRAPGTFRVDMKMEKAFNVAGFGMVTPYLWIENLLNIENAVDVWRSTGSPYTTNFLSTDNGKILVESNGEAWAEDYKSLERDPDNFGIPRLIKLGVKVNFSF